MNRDPPLSLLDYIAFDLIRDRAARGRQPPSLKEVERAIGSKGAKPATATLQRLQTAGLITRDTKHRRTSRPSGVQAPEKPVMPPSKRLHRKARMARLARIRSPDTVPSTAIEPVTAR